MAETQPHAVLADTLRRRALDHGAIPRSVRAGALAAGAGSAADLPDVYDALARLVGEASYRVTDRQVAAARDAAGSDKAVFEIVMSASIGAGLRRWDAAASAIDGATGAPA